MTSCNSTKRLSDGLTQRRNGAEDSLGVFFFAPSRLCVILLATASAAAADWPFARGGVESQGAAEFAIGDEPQLLWSYEPDGEVAFEGAPVIGDGVVYLADADGGLHALSLDDAKALWTASLPDTIVLAAPALGVDRVFVGDADGFVHAVSRADGSVQWKVEVEGEVYAGPILYTPAEGEPLLLVTTELGRLSALDPETGAERWRFEIKDPLRCAPTVVNGHALLAGCDGNLHAINLSDGTESGAADIGGPTGCTAAVLEGVAYFGTESGEFYAVDANDTNQPKVVWTSRDPRRRQGVRTAAAVSETTVVYGNQGKGLYALDPSSGEQLWTKTLRSKIEAGPLIVGDRVLVATSRGRIRLLDLSTGEETWSFDAGGGFLAAPAASAGRIILASTDGLVYCFGE